MHNSRSLIAALTVLTLLPVTPVSATSDTIISAGLISGSSDYSAFSFETGLTVSINDISPINDFAADINIASAQVGQHKTRVLDESLWSPGHANLSNNSVYLQRAGQDSRDAAIVELEASTGFNFHWENHYQPRESLLKKGLKQYLALEDKADFDFRILKPRVIHISADPLEYSIMNDLCFIKKCFF